jgi:hypothetical protein
VCPLSTHAAIRAPDDDAAVAVAKSKKKKRKRLDEAKNGQKKRSKKHPHEGGEAALFLIVSPVGCEDLKNK